MLIINKVQIHGWEPAIRGMRNPLESWSKSDSITDGDTITIGPKDEELMMKLAKTGPEHAKYKRMITVYMDITAPLYWWKEFDTYKVGTVANSCSTMHSIHKKKFLPGDFSCEHLGYFDEDAGSDGIVEACPFETGGVYPIENLLDTIDILNYYRERYLETKDKKYWWQMIQLLPSSYNQTRTVMLNYEVLTNIYRQRKEHKLDEWRAFCKRIEDLPYSQLITLKDSEPAHSTAYWIKVTGPEQPTAYQCSRCKKCVDKPTDRCEQCGSEMEGGVSV